VLRLAIRLCGVASVRGVGVGIVLGVGGWSSWSAIFFVLLWEMDVVDLDLELEPNGGDEGGCLFSMGWLGGLDITWRMRRFFLESRGRYGLDGLCEVGRYLAWGSRRSLIEGEGLLVSDDVGVVNEDVAS